MTFKNILLASFFFLFLSEAQCFYCLVCKDNSQIMCNPTSMRKCTGPNSYCFTLWKRENGQMSSSRGCVNREDSANLKVEQKCPISITEGSVELCYCNTDRCNEGEWDHSKDRPVGATHHHQKQSGETNADGSIGKTDHRQEPPGGSDADRSAGTSDHDKKQPGGTDGGSESAGTTDHLKEQPGGTDSTGSSGTISSHHQEQPGGSDEDGSAGTPSQHQEQPGGSDTDGSAGTTHHLKEQPEGSGTKEDGTKDAKTNGSYKNSVQLITFLLQVFLVFYTFTN